MLVVSTGTSNNIELDTLEGFTISSSDRSLAGCSLPRDHSKHAAVSMATGGILKAFSRGRAYPVPVVCGGVLPNKYEHFAKCFILDSERSVMAGSLTRQRKGAASAVFRNGTTLWVTGGYDNDILLDSTELVQLVSQNSSNDGVDQVVAEAFVALPVPASSHCLQMVGTDTALMYGGDYGDWQVSWNVWLATNIDNNQTISWSQSEPLGRGRMQHMCGVLKTSYGQDYPHQKRIVVAAGGIESSFDNIFTDTVELLYFYRVGNSYKASTNGWEEGPRIPFKLCCAASATTEDHTKIFVAGGAVSHTPYHQSQYILSIDCIKNICVWVTGNALLGLPRSNGVAILVPPPPSASNGEEKYPGLDACNIYNDKRGS